MKATCRRHIWYGRDLGGLHTNVPSSSKFTIRFSIYLAWRRWLLSLVGLKWYAMPPYNFARSARQKPAISFRSADAATGASWLIDDFIYNTICLFIWLYMRHYGSAPRPWMSDFSPLTAATCDDSKIREMPFQYKACSISWYNWALPPQRHWYGASTASWVPRRGLLYATPATHHDARLPDAEQPNGPPPPRATDITQYYAGKGEENAISPPPPPFSPIYYGEAGPPSIASHALIWWFIYYASRARARMMPFHAPNTMAIWDMILDVARHAVAYGHLSHVTHHAAPTRYRRGRSSPSAGGRYQERRRYMMIAAPGWEGVITAAW